jgi:hypothetical protein
MKISKIAAVVSWTQDLKKGLLIKHQPARSRKHSEWYLVQLEKEGRRLSK